MPEAATHGNLISSISCATIRQALLDVGGGLSNVVAIHPETRAVTGRTADPDTAAAWAADQNARGHNVYFSVNAPVPGAPDGKLRKADIATIRAIHVDLDPAGPDIHAERARLRSVVETAAATSCPPTAVIDSGGGYQLFWILDAPIPASPENTRWAEDQGRSLAVLFGGDRTQNVDRIMRLPGSINWPDAKKRAAGRTPALASAVKGAGSRRTVTREQLEAYAPPRAAHTSEAPDQSEEIAAIYAAIDMQAAYEGPDADLTARLEAAAQANAKLKAVIDGDRLHGDDQSASAYRAALVAQLCITGGFTPTDYAAIAQHLPQCRGRDYDDAGWKRQYAREWVNVGVRNAVEHWFSPVEAPAPDSPAALFERMTEAARKQDGEAGTNPARFQFLSFHDAADTALDASTTPLIKGLLDQQAMTVLYGESNVGKTFVALDIAYHIWAGVDYAGMRTSQGDIIYIAAEGGKGILKRIRALKIDRAPSRQTGFHVLPSQVDLLNPEADLSDLIAAIRSVCERPALIVVDTLSRALAGGDENSSTDMGALVRNLDTLRGATTAHVMVIHHTGKDRAKGARGHSLLRAATDTEIEVSEGSIEVTKQRELDKSWGSGFRLRSVAIGFDADGEPVSSPVVDLCPREEAAVGGEGEGGNGEAVEVGGPLKKGERKAGSLVQLVSVVRSLCASSPDRRTTTKEVLAAYNRAQSRAKDKITEKTLLNKLVVLKNEDVLSSPMRGVWTEKQDELSYLGVFG